MNYIVKLQVDILMIRWWTEIFDKQRNTYTFYILLLSVGAVSFFPTNEATRALPSVYTPVNYQPEKLGNIFKTTVMTYYTLNWIIT